MEGGGESDRENGGQMERGEGKLGGGGGSERERERELELENFNTQG